MSREKELEALRITFDFRYGQRRCRAQLFDKFLCWQLSATNKSTVPENTSFQESMQRMQSKAEKCSASCAHTIMEPEETESFTIVPFCYVIGCSVTFSKQLVGGSVTPPSPRPRDVVLSWARPIGNRLAFRVTRFNCECHRRNRDGSDDENPSDDECQCETFRAMVEAQLENLSRPRSVHFFISCIESSKASFSKIEPYFKLANCATENHDLEWTISSFNDSKYGVYKCGSLASLIRSAPTSTCVILGSRQQQKRFVSGLLYAYCYNSSVPLCPSDLANTTSELNCPCKLGVLPAVGLEAQISASLRVILGHTTMVDVSAVFEIRKDDYEENKYNSVFMDWGFLIGYGPLSKYFVRCEYKFVESKQRNLIAYFKKRMRKSQPLQNAKNRTKLTRDFKLYYKQAGDANSLAGMKEKSKRNSQPNRKQLFTARRTSLAARICRDLKWKSSHFDGFQLACITNAHWSPNFYDDTQMQSLSRNTTIFVLQNFSDPSQVKKDRVKILKYSGREFCINFGGEAENFRSYVEMMTRESGSSNEVEMFNQSVDDEMQVLTLDDDMPDSSCDGSPANRPRTSKDTTAHRSLQSLHGTANVRDLSTSSSEAATPNRSHAAIIGMRKKKNNHDTRRVTDDDECESQQDITIGSTQRKLKLSGLKARLSKFVSGNFLPNRKEKFNNKNDTETESPVTAYENEAASEETTPRAAQNDDTRESTPTHEAVEYANDPFVSRPSTSGGRSQSNYDLFSAEKSTQRRSSQTNCTIADSQDDKALIWTVDDRVFTQTGGARIRTAHVVLCPGILTMFEGANYFHNYS